MLVEYLPPFTAVFGRVGIAALVLILVLALRGETLPLTRGAWRRFAIMAALNNAIPFALIAYGETAIASGLESILNPSSRIRRPKALFWGTGARYQFDIPRR